MSVTSQALPSS